jgi:hypothetical protein
MYRSIVLVVGLLLAFASEAQEKRSAKAFMGPSAITSSDGSTGQGLTLGYHSAAGGKKIAGMWGLEFLGVDVANSNAFFPVFTVLGGLHMTPLPTERVVPYVNIGLGAAFVLIFPAPTVSIDLGIQFPLGTELKFDLALHGRAVANPFDGQTTGASTLALGLGF